MRLPRTQDVIEHICLMVFCVTTFPSRRLSAVRYFSCTGLMIVLVRKICRSLATALTSDSKLISFATALTSDSELTQTLWEVRSVDIGEMLFAFLVCIWSMLCL